MDFGIHGGFWNQSSAVPTDDYTNKALSTTGWKSSEPFPTAGSGNHGNEDDHQSTHITP